MFERVLSIIMTFLKSFWISREAVIDVKEEPGLLNEPDEIVLGDDISIALEEICELLNKRLHLSDNAFDPALYKLFNTQIENHTWYVSMLKLLSQQMQNQTKDPDTNFYLDEPVLKGLARGVPVEREIGSFLTQGNVRTFHDAYVSLHDLANEVKTDYIAFIAHPAVNDIIKDYYRRTMHLPLSILKDYLDFLYLHGNINDSEKETNSSKSVIERTRQTH